MLVINAFTVHHGYGTVAGRSVLTPTQPSAFANGGYNPEDSQEQNPREYRPGCLNKRAFGMVFGILVIVFEFTGVPPWCG